MRYNKAGSCRPGLLHSSPALRPSAVGSGGKASGGGGASKAVASAGGVGRLVKSQAASAAADGGDDDDDDSPAEAAKPKPKVCVWGGEGCEWRGGAARVSVLRSCLT